MKDVGRRHITQRFVVPAEVVVVDEVGDGRLQLAGGVHMGPGSLPVWWYKIAAPIAA